MGSAKWHIFPAARLWTDAIHVLRLPFECIFLAPTETKRPVANDAIDTALLLLSIQHGLKAWPVDLLEGTIIEMLNGKTDGCYPHRNVLFCQLLLRESW